MKPAIIILTFVILNLTGSLIFPGSAPGSSGYNLTSPDKYLTLPENLKEVSGLTAIDSVSFACIQDENGILFLYDLTRNRIKDQIIFYGNGDYEDITRVNKTFYVLRSDGTLFEISGYMSKPLKVVTYKTGIPSADNEGLCYDPKNNRLLISCKGEINKENLKNKRAIYSFDLKTKKLLPDPAFVLDLKSVKKYVSEKKLRKSGKKDDDEKNEISLKVSAIAIHPVTGRLFLLSADDYLLYILSKTGIVESIETLDRKLFRKAEGLAFFNNGDMLITNEAEGEKPTLLRFNYKKK